MTKAAAKFPDARKYQDWRELLEAEGDKIDSVQVAIPDHMHASVSIAAMKKNKHVHFLVWVGKHSHKNHFHMESLLVPFEKFVLK